MSHTLPASLDVEEQNKLRIVQLAKTGYTFEEILNMAPQVEPTLAAAYYKEYLVSTREPEPTAPATVNEAQRRLMKLRAALEPQVLGGSVMAVRTALQIEIELARLAGLYADKPDADESVRYEITGVSEEDLT